MYLTVVIIRFVLGVLAWAAVAVSAVFFALIYFGTWLVSKALGLDDPKKEETW